MPRKSSVLRSLKTALFSILLLVASAVLASNATDSHTTVSTTLEDLDRASGTEEEMQTLLNWALEHSDPKKLKELAADVEAGRSDLNLEDIEAVLRKRKELRETMAYLEKANPSESVLIKEAIAVLNRTTGLPVDPSLEEDLGGVDPSDVGMQRRALQQLASLLEPLDNANDFPKMGGLTPLLASLTQGPTQAIQCAALDVLRVAASNNPAFVDALLTSQPGALAAVAVLSRGEGVQPPREAAEDNCDVAVKALVALSNVLRANEGARAAFLSSKGGGLTYLEDLMVRTGEQRAAARKARAEHERNVKLELRVLSLVEDMFESGSMAGVPYIASRSLANHVLQRLVDQVQSTAVTKAGPGLYDVSEFELLEKTLRAARSVASLSSGVLPLGRADRNVLAKAHKIVVQLAKKLDRAAREDPESWSELHELAAETQKELKERVDSPDEMKGLL